MYVFIGIAVGLIGLAYLYINEVYSFWKKKGVPNPPPRFPVGNIGNAFTRKQHMGCFYKNMYNNYKGYSYIGLYNCLRPIVLIRSVDLIKEVMVKEFSSFHDNDIQIDEKADPLFGKNPFILNGDRWKAVRTQVTSALTSGKIKQMFTIIRNISEELVKYLNNEPEATGKDGLEAKELSAKFTTDVVAACAFGLDGKSFLDPDAEFKTMGRKLFKPSFIFTIKTTLIFMFPDLATKLKISLASKEIKDWFSGTLHQIIKYREENNVVRNDYLDTMLSYKSKPGEYEFTNVDVIAQAMTFFSDGMETSATSLSFTLYEIAKHPEIQEKLRKEVDTVLAKYNGEITYEAVQEMKYSDMVISETLRMYPPALFAQKICTKQFTLPPPGGEGTGPGVVIDPGTTVVIPLYAIHYDPQYYPDPHTFDPERFTEEAKNNRPKCAYIPFGEGPRICMGFRFAFVQIKAALAATVTNFEIKVNPKTSPKMEVDALSLILSKKGGIWLNFNKRSI